MPDIINISEEQAREAGAICGALLFGYLWNLQSESLSANVPTTLPIRPKTEGKRYLSIKEAAIHLGVGRTKFYEYKERDDFPQPNPETGKYLASDIDRFDKKIKHKKA